jgi:protein involved in temperature-dependent protein secretion
VPLGACRRWRDSGPIYAWPPPTPPVFASSVVLPGPGPDWQAEIKARNAAQREESERAIAHLRELARERRERELKEGKEAIAREVAERNRRHGWPH